ncbi:Elongation of very long chain fatty acids protein 7 [Frankliniella fusca]|uniref:Elongation of very long chain fatty acids protein n=1 Tax=Frankliniella fusca TaxID=407009 RepID=A0AAE1LST6_9NEOP|nr:Elongation of very long chain fatty acids protein 7 [Frankliniella fusca]
MDYTMAWSASAMAALISSAIRGYDFLFYELADPRTNQLPLIGNPFHGLAILGFYLYFVLNLGPRLMEGREPFNVKPIMTAFNIFQIGSSVFIFYKIAWYVWFYMTLKFIDLLDTVSATDTDTEKQQTTHSPEHSVVFIVLRKNQRQVTFLHVYHHTGVAMALWGAVKYYPGGHGTLMGLVNSFVHSIMYGYYLLTTIAPEYKKSIWWKKYITIMQLVQFVILGLHALAIVFIPNCEYQPKFVYVAIMVPQNFFMFMLFYNFYVQAYGSGAKNKSKAASRCTYSGAQCWPWVVLHECGEDRVQLITSPKKAGSAPVRLGSAASPVQADTAAVILADVDPSWPAQVPDFYRWSDLPYNMSAIVQTVVRNYHDIVRETKVDPMVDSWFLMGSPLPILSILAVYLWFVLKAGPAFMASRKPYNLQPILILYNGYQVLFSLWLCTMPLRVNAIPYLLKHGCHPLQNQHNPFTIAYLPGEQGVVIGFLNSVVHVVLYTYYLIAALGPKYQKYLWWKKYVTKIQLAQFCIMLLYLGTLLLFDCRLPKALTFFFVGNVVIFLFLFADFYRKAYARRPSRNQQQEENKVTASSSSRNTVTVLPVNGLSKRKLHTAQ